MSDASSERLERLEVLLAEEAVGQLDRGQRDELDILLREFPDFDRNSFIRAAAAMDLALSSSPFAEMPEKLKRAIADAAENHVPKRGTTDTRLDYEAIKRSGPPVALIGAVNGKAKRQPVGDDSRASRTGALHSHADTFPPKQSSADRDTADRDTADRDTVSPVPPTAAFDGWRWAGWLAASAAVLGMLVLQFVTTSKRVAVTSEQQRLQLIAEPASRVYPWETGPTPLSMEIRGDVVWNQEKQAGFMLFDGLPMNDATLEQYQLWIIDPQRDRHPIDGGVFDIGQAGIVVVPINAKLKVVEPHAFAITIEKPGGVVVSDQSRLPLLASVTGN